MFKETALRLALSSVWPAFILWLIYGGKHADVNDVVDSLFYSIVVLYPGVCLVEFLFAVIMRTLITQLFEAEVFRLFPDTPGLRPYIVSSYTYVFYIQFSSASTLSVIL
jgi:hypothetical protein